MEMATTTRQAGSADMLLPVPLSSPNFPNLPFELRRQIWKLMILPPRVIHGGCRRLAVPTILHVCHESRAEGLLHYQLINYSSFLLPCYVYKDAKGYLNLKEDIILMDASTMKYGMHDKQLIAQIQHIGFEMYFWEALMTEPSYHVIFEEFRQSKALKSVLVLPYFPLFWPMSGRYLERWNNSGGLETPELLAKLEEWRMELIRDRETFPDWNCPELGMRL